MRHLWGTVVRLLKPFKNERPSEVLIYHLRRGRKHPWFILRGYELVNRTVYINTVEGSVFEEHYEVVKKYTVEEMLTHEDRAIRRLGLIVSEKPRLKINDVLKRICLMSQKDTPKNE